MVLVGWLLVGAVSYDPAIGPEPYSKALTGPDLGDHPHSLHIAPPRGIHPIRHNN